MDMDTDTDEYRCRMAGLMEEFERKITFKLLVVMSGIGLAGGCCGSHAFIIIFLSSWQSWKETGCPMYL